MRNRAEIESTLRTRAGLREAGTIKAATGAAGLSGVGGSAASILGESARNAAFDLGTIETQSELEAKAILKGGKAAKTAGNIGFAASGFSAASTLLGG